MNSKFFLSKNLFLVSLDEFKVRDKPDKIVRILLVVKVVVFVLRTAEHVCLFEDFNLDERC